MTYWIYNTLVIQGIPQELERFSIENKDNSNSLSFQKRVPLSIPLKSKTQYDIDIEEESSGDDKQPEAIKQAKELWGCKWNLNSVNYTRNKDSIEYIFLTRDNAPIAWLTKVSNIYPTLLFSLKSECTETDILMETEWQYGQQKKYSEVSMARTIYENDQGDRIALQIIDLIKDNHKIKEEWLNCKQTFMQWLEEDTDELKESILSIMDEEECYDYPEYLFKRIKELLQ